MAKPTGGLGKGLGALLKKAELPEKKISGEVEELSIDKIVANINQPRTNFDKEALSELEASIKEYGILQPLLVKKIGEKYEIIAGERRYRAAKSAGLKTVPVIIKEYTNAQQAQIALIENLQREDLNILEEAIAYARLISDFKLTQDEVAQKIGKSRPHVANCLRLLKLPQKIQTALQEGSLTMGQARPLLALDDIDIQLAAAECIITEGMSARAAEELVKDLLNRKNALKKQKEQKKSKPKTENDIFLSDIEDKLKLFFGTKVKITAGKKKSSIEIEFSSKDELERIIETLLEKQNTNIEQKKQQLRAFSKKNFSV